MTLLKKLKIAIGRNLISSATGRWYPNYPLEAYFYGDQSFSQCGEDLAIANLLTQLDHEGAVHYVDIGCFHPIKYSNTFYHYLRGGSGLVVDMNETHKQDFHKYRPRDKFVKALISDLRSPQNVRINGNPNDRILNGKLQMESLQIQPKTLAHILDEFWPENQIISFLDIDCEGHEINVINSNNWIKYRPRVVVMEGFSKEDKENLEKCMANYSYSCIARLRHALFFIEI
jgi:hypothetical protein